MLARTKRDQVCSAARSLWIAGLAFLCAAPALAATFTVNSVADTADPNPVDALCDVDLALPGFQCTLRAAIQEANFTVEQDTINFSIPGGTDPVIVMDEAELPEIIYPVIIDGTTQPGAMPELEWYYEGPPPRADGLRIVGGGSVVRGLAFYSFTSDGIELFTSGGNVITGCIFGSDAAFDPEKELESNGVRIYDSADNIIGGSAPGEGNIFVRCETNGILIEGPGSTGNRVIGNHIGVTPAGEVTGGNSQSNGVVIWSAWGNIIGGTAHGEGNVIAGNTRHNVEIAGGRVEVPISLAQPEPIPDLNIRGFGLRFPYGRASDLDAKMTFFHPAPGDVFLAISNRPASDGQTMVDTNLSPPGNTVPDYIDTVFDDDAAQLIYEGAPPYTGSFIPDDPLNFFESREMDGAWRFRVGDLVQNTTTGEFAAGSLILTYESSFNNRVEGNLIGVLPDGSVPTVPALRGVRLVGDVRSNLIGGSTPAARNVISGHSIAGVAIEVGLPDGSPLPGVVTTANQVAGNYIGTNAAGTAAVPNFVGVDWKSGAGDTVGGLLPGEGNVISGNTVGGLFINAGDLANSLVANNRIGTDASGAAALPNGGDGVFVSAQNLSVGAAGAGNVISGNFSNGVFVQGPLTDAVSIVGNLIGIDASGNAPLPNGGMGVRANADGAVVIGSGLEDEGNVISANASHGILQEGAGMASILGNKIGLNAAGSLALPNGGDGIRIESGDANAVGGSDFNSRNFIAGNPGWGLRIVGPNLASGVFVSGNYIGLAAAGAFAIPNALGGIRIEECGQHIIGGSSAGDGNVISGNGGPGISIAAANATLSDLFIRGNRIGTTADGAASLGNAGPGIKISGPTSGEIGGSLPDERNVVSGNTNGIEIQNASLWNVFNNFVGSDVSGENALPNASDGIRLINSSQITLGGDAATQGNVILGNLRHGINISGVGVSQLFVRGNRIGVSASGAARGNGRNGILIADATEAEIWGSIPEYANTIAHNGSAGVAVIGDASNIRIQANRIFSNGGLGIDLGADGITENDAADLDSGPNGLQNAPVLTELVAGRAKSASGSGLPAPNAAFNEVRGRLEGPPFTTYRIDFYSSLAPDPSGRGEAETFLDYLIVDTDESGVSQFSFFPLAPILPFEFISATASRNGMETSEFSPVFPEYNRARSAWRSYR